MEKSTRELEWFDLEIRTREVIHQQLEPVLNKAREDREGFMNLKNYCAKLEKRIKELEVSVLGDRAQETVIANIYELCGTIEGQRKKDCVRIDQDLDNINEKIKGLNFLLEKTNEEIICIQTKEETTESELQKIKEIIDTNKVMIIEDIANLDVRFKELNQVYKEVSLRAEEKSVLAMNKAQTNTLEMGNYKREVENIRKHHLDTLTTVREVKANKLEETDFTLAMAKLDSKFTEVVQQMAHFTDELSHRDRFIDKFIPLQTATMISDYLHFTLELPYRRRVAEFESSVLTDLNNQAISNLPSETRQARIQKILDDMKHMEERKVKLLTDSKPRDGEHDKKPKPKKANPKQGENERDPEVVKEKVEAPQTQTIFQNMGPDLAQVEKLIDDKISPLHTSLLRVMQEEMNARQEANKSYFKSIIQENNSLLNQVIVDFEENSKNLKRENSQLSKDLGGIKATLEDLRKSVKSFEGSLVSLTRMVVCLVENAQIEQALEAQDEEDRHAMVQGYERELQSELAISKPRGSPEPYTSGLPSGLAIQKKCLGCSNNASLISGFRTTVTYKPTPLLYRNKKFERPSLISFRGRMVKECWEEVSQNIPWKQEDIENLVAETYKNLKLGSVIDDESTNNLPALNLATRNRSYGNRKIRFNKISM